MFPSTNGFGESYIFESANVVSSAKIYEVLLGKFKFANGNREEALLTTYHPSESFSRDFFPWRETRKWRYALGRKLNQEKPIMEMISSALTHATGSNLLSKLIFSQSWMLPNSNFSAFYQQSI